MTAPEIVMKAKYPLPLDGLDKLVSAAKRFYGDDLVILTDHPEAREWMIIARPGDEDASGTDKPKSNGITATIERAI